jgi:hypothetical protein
VRHAVRADHRIPAPAVSAIVAAGGLNAYPATRPAAWVTTLAGLPQPRGLK